MTCQQHKEVTHPQTNYLWTQAGRLHSYNARDWSVGSSYDKCGACAFLWNGAMKPEHRGREFMEYHCIGADNPGIREAQKIWYFVDAENWVDGKIACSSRGYRQCTVEEFREDITRGSGCGYDSNLCWAEDACVTEQGAKGHKVEWGRYDGKEDQAYPINDHPRVDNQCVPDDETSASLGIMVSVRRCSDRVVPCQVGKNGNVCDNGGSPTGTISGLETVSAKCGCSCKDGFSGANCEIRPSALTKVTSAWTGQKEYLP
jgi:hypothetical protein